MENIKCTVPICFQHARAAWSCQILWWVCKFAYGGFTSVTYIGRSAQSGGMRWCGSLELPIQVCYFTMSSFDVHDFSGHSQACASSRMHACVLRHFRENISLSMGKHRYARGLICLFRGLACLGSIAWQSVDGGHYWMTFPTKSYSGEIFRGSDGPKI